jgi:hypothetical protein
MGGAFGRARAAVNKPKKPVPRNESSTATFKISDRLRDELPTITLQFRLAQLAGSRCRIDVEPQLLNELAHALMAVHQGKPAGRVFRQNERTKPKRKDSHAIALLYWYSRVTSSDISRDEGAIHYLKRAKHVTAPVSKATIRKIAQKYRDDTLNYLEIATGAPWGLQMMIFGLVSYEEMSLTDDSDILPTDEAEIISESDEAKVVAQVNALVPPVTLSQVKALRKYLKKKGPHFVDK